MVFLPGDHVLDMNITVANVTRLTMHGESSSGNTTTIVCCGSVGLSFTSMMELKIGSLAFTSCTKRYATILPGSSLGIIQVAMFLQSTQHTEVDSCSFHDNLGTALLVNNTTLAGSTKFAHTRSCSSITGAVRGAIIALSSKLAFTGNSTFLDNSADSPRQCSLYNNATAVLGGTIYTLDNTIITFSGTNYFLMNRAAIVVAPSLYPTILHLFSMEPTTSSTTQQVRVVQSTLMEVRLASMGPTNLSTT